jgi:hypothetical protein
MQELRLVAVSEDGSYAILAVPGRGGRFSLPIDDRLRAVARGQLSRLAQYEIEVENPLRPKEIQDRIRAGQTADEIADLAGIPIDRIRRFEGPVLAEREYRAQEAQRATVRSPGDSGPGPRLGEVVAERLSQAGVAEDDTRWDSRKRSDGNWQVHLTFSVGGRSQAAEWIFDPQRRHVVPDDEQAARLCLTDADLAAVDLDPDSPATATVTPIARRHAGAGPHYQPRDPRERDGATDFPGPRDYQAQRDQAQREAGQREAAQRARREQAAREQAQHEAAQHEQAQHEAAQHEAAQHEAAQHEAAQREQAQRERQALRARALEQARREHPSREQARAAGQREPSRREAAQREAAQHESAEREQAQREAAQRQSAQREAAQREAAQHESAEREQAQREAAQRQSAQREAAQRQSAQQETAQREAARREAARRDAPSRDSGPREPQVASGPAGERSRPRSEPQVAAASGDPGSRAERPGPARPGRAAASRQDRAAEAETGQAAPRPVPERPARKTAGGRSRRASVPSWDEIMFGNSRNSD